MYTDGTSEMLGSRSGFVKVAKEKTPSIIHCYCVIYRIALATKTLPSELENVLNVCIRVVHTSYTIKSSAFNSHNFKIVYSELSAEHSDLLIHSEFPWLSKGNMVECLYELKSKLEIILLQLGKDDLPENFTNENFIF